MAAERKTTPSQTEVEDSFREDLASTIVVIESLQGQCNNISDLVEVLRLAETNQGQLKLVMLMVTAAQRSAEK